MHILKQMKAFCFLSQSFTEKKPGFSVKDCLRKQKQESNLLLINSHLTKKSKTENPDCYAFD